MLAWFDPTKMSEPCRFNLEAEEPEQLNHRRCLSGTALACTT